MTQLGELVQIGFVNADEIKCPFDHEAEKPPNVSNDFVGVGKTLGANMKSASSTFLYEKLRKVQQLDPVLNPRDDPAHALYRKGVRKPRPITLWVRKSGSEPAKPHGYTLTCAAHHCIPAQESLKHSQLLEYMVKKGGKENIKDGDSIKQFSNGVVWSDVGYDVNGLENGVYLPGNYAVGGGIGGMGVWEGSDDNDQEEDETPASSIAPLDIEGTSVDVPSSIPGIDDPIVDSAPSSNRLDGVNYVIDKNSRKWRYVQKAMVVAGGQFHDRHEEYSGHVLSRLQKIYNNYVLLEEDAQLSCPDCQKRAKKIKEFGMPTPYGLVARLNGMSKYLRGYLTGSRWSPLLYTSKWVCNYVNGQKSGTS